MVILEKEWIVFTEFTSIVLCNLVWTDSEHKNNALFLFACSVCDLLNTDLLWFGKTPATSQYNVINSSNRQVLQKPC